ncbi:MAG TPA: glycoside hydrolase family 3 C-terminal domain-containing protein [Prolixibacteraceae bacterium]
MTSQPAQQKIAYEVASKSIVLLKNEGVLPLKLENKPVIAVIGANATQIMATGGLGAGVKTLYEVTPLEGLKNRIGDKAEIIFAKGYEPAKFTRGRKTPEQLEKEKQEKELATQKLTNEALEVAAKANVILFIGGDNRSVETEGSDRKDIFLPSGQDELIRKIAEVNPNIVTVLTSGAPNDLNVVNSVSKALLISWFNGTEGGNALADVLVGNISPSGRLPFTIPVKLEDSPAYALGNYPQGKKNADVFANLVSETDPAVKSPNKKEETQKADPNNARYSEESLVGYRWFDTKKVPVMYPFGTGLTYTTFEYANLKTDKEKYGKNDVITISVELKNTGKMAADEVAQVYVHHINSKVEWPQKELKAFSRITLNPNENKTVKLEIPVENLRFWNEKIHKWDDDLCKIELLVGASAGDIKLKKEVTLK